MPAGLDLGDEARGPGGCARHLLRVDQREQFERVLAFAVGGPGLAVHGGGLERVIDCRLVHALDGPGAGGQSARFESLTEECLQCLSIRQEPALHTLDHEVTIIVLDPLGLGPLVALAFGPVRPGFPARRLVALAMLAVHRRFAVD